MYPEPEDLERIRTWGPGEHGDFPGLMDFIRSLWHFADAGYFTQEGEAFHLSTAGWSGNEDIIEALEANGVFWMTCWQRSERGGHYRFTVKPWPKPARV